MSLLSSWSITIRNGLLLLLACTAGAIDAVSYLELGRVFTANMTGNTVLLGLAIVQGDRPEALRASLALMGFLGGGALGAWIVERGTSVGLWPRPVTVALALEWGFLGLFALGWRITGGGATTGAARGTLIVLSALAMGMQSAAARRLEVSGIATTYITGTVTTLMAWLIRWLGGDGGSGSISAPAGSNNADVRQHAGRAVGLLAAVWGVYIGGAMVVGVLMHLIPEWAMLFPLALLLIVVVTAAVHWPP